MDLAQLWRTHGCENDTPYPRISSLLLHCIESNVLSQVVRPFKLSPKIRIFKNCCRPKNNKAKHVFLFAFNSIFFLIDCNRDDYAKNTDRHTTFEASATMANEAFIH